MYSGSMMPYEIDALALQTLLQQKTMAPDDAASARFVLLDVREPWEYRTAQIEGSVSIPMDQVPARAFQELDPESHIVTICHLGVRSMNVAVWLRNQGFELTQSLRGGIDSWSRLVDPMVPRY